MSTSFVEPKGASGHGVAMTEEPAGSLLVRLDSFFRDERGSELLKLSLSAPSPQGHT